MVTYDVIRGNVEDYATLSSHSNLLVAEVFRDNKNRQGGTKAFKVLKRDTDKLTYEIVE